MSNRTRAIFLSLTIVAVMLVSAVGTTNVYADDGTPPPPPTETVVVDQPTEEPVVTSEPVEPVATAEPTEVVPAEEAPVVEEQAPVEEAATILEQVPEDTAVTVLNNEGEAQPLTSQESADAILTSDPVWCPGTTTLPGGAGCTPSFSSFDELLDYLADPVNAITGAGTIYVQMGTYTGPETTIDFNAYDLSNISNSDLTVQGGWDPGDNSTTDTSKLNVPIVIGSSLNPWVGSLTIKSLEIDNVTSGTGLTLVSSNNITLSNVTVTNSKGGADLDAGKRVRVSDSKFNSNKEFGAKIKAGTFVDVVNSEFNDNKSDDVDAFGLKIESLKDVAFDGVYAERNELFGANINSQGDIWIENSVFSGNIAYTTDCVWIGAKDNKAGCHWECSTVINGNGGYGLNAVSSTYAYLDGVTAEENYLYGAHVEAPAVEIYNSHFNLNGSFNGEGAEGNVATGKGLEVVSTDSVTLASVEANNNQAFGANIQATGQVEISDSFFDGNQFHYESCVWIGAKDNAPSCHWECTDVYDGYGLQVVSASTVMLNEVSASNNYLYGAHLEGSYVSVSGGTFNNNASPDALAVAGKGLEIVSTGGVSLANVAANDNQAFGANIQAAGNVNVSIGFFNNNLYSYETCVWVGAKDNQASCHEECTTTYEGYGLKIVTSGAINLYGVQANGNGTVGTDLTGSSVLIDNGSTSGGTQSSTFNNNKKQGLVITTTGGVSLTGVTANSNSLAGANITAGDDVSIVGSFFSGNLSYAGSTYYGYGLNVVTTGNINLNNVVADENYLYGAHLEGASVFIYGDILGDGIFGTSFSNNGTGNPADHVGKGLEVISTGSNVTLSGVAANGNQLFGANIQAGNAYVSITNSTFNGNHSYYTNCTKTTGTGGGKPSGGSGGTKPGCGGGGQTCTKTYDGYGLNVVTTNDIYVSDIEANENYLFGAHLEGANVTVEDSTFDSNASPVEQGKTPTGRGLEVISTGDTLLNGVEASNNQLFGADVNAGGNVTVSSSFFEGNKYSVSCKTKGYGLKVVTTAPDGTITLTDVTATGNGAEGVILDGQSTIDVTGGTFNSNGASGLDVTAQGGDVTLDSIEASENQGDGVSVKGACTNTVNVSGGNFNSNGKYGLKIVDATYNEVVPPSYDDNNGSGNFFQSDCNSGGDTGGGDTGGGDTGGGNTGGGWNGWNGGWNWWNWWMFWYYYGHH